MNSAAAFKILATLACDVPDCESCRIVTAIARARTQTAAVISDGD